MIFRKPRRRVNRVFIHCSASDNPAHDNAATIDKWHKQRGWRGIGYHYFIRKDGRIERGRNLERRPAAQAGHNLRTIAICLHGLDVNKFTQAQFRSLNKLCDEINAAYNGKITFHGHNEVAAKACPVFNYKKVLGLDSRGRKRSSRVATYNASFDPPVTQLEGPVAGKPVSRSRTINMATLSGGLGAAAAGSSAAAEIAHNTTSITSLVANPWIWVMIVIVAFTAYIVYDRYFVKGEEYGA